LSFATIPGADVRHFLCALGCFCGLASAATPLPFGLDLQSADWVGAHEATTETAVTQTGVLDDAIFALDAMQRELGPYHPDLVAPTLAAAALATQTGALSRAEQLYDRALHTVRVNDGLYGDQQLPILRGLLDLYLTSGDREGFEKRADYQLRLMGSGVPPFNSAELSAAGEFFDVTLDALMDASWEGKSRELLRFHDRVEALTEAVCADAEFGMEWCQPFSFRLVRFYYLLEYKLDVLVDDPRFEPRLNGADWQSMEREPRLEALQRRLFQQGERVFDRLLALKPEDHDALSALADWHWFYQKRPAAIRHYQAACKLRPERFDHPAPLPEYPTLGKYQAFTEIGAAVSVTLEVNERGVPSDIVLEPADVEAALSLKRKLRATRFRPIFDNCESPRPVSLLNSEFVRLD
jgi:tetratricopeptide (TPR) repeat protein